MSARFSDCSFSICDLPGQCLGEGKCHHPVSKEDQQLRAQLTTLQAKLEAAEKDAASQREAFNERYRKYLRDRDINGLLYSLGELKSMFDKAAIAQNGKESFDQSEWKENNLPVAERNRAKE